MEDTEQMPPIWSHSGVKEALSRGRWNGCGCHVQAADVHCLIRCSAVPVDERRESIAVAKAEAEAEEAERQLQEAAEAEAQAAASEAFEAAAAAAALEEEAAELAGAKFANYKPYLKL